MPLAGVEVTTGGGHPFRPDPVRREKGEPKGSPTRAWAGGGAGDGQCEASTTSPL
jgi:hypothetical protein